jgi:predicted RNase H-like nuclease (RuvC/YqgF family)
MKTLITTVFLGLSILTACGPSAEEKARLQKAREDSIRVATENATRHKLEMKLALTDSVKNLEALKEGIENRLTYLKGELEVAKDKMTRIKEVQFLRTPDEREQQIRSQALTIDQLEKEIEELPDRIQQTTNKIAKTKSELKKYE